MKASELRIGSWVDCNKKRHNEKFIKVESICSEGINILFRRYEIDDLLPIPLTEELILKCGFTVDRKTGWGGYLSPKVTNQQFRLKPDPEIEGNYYLAFSIFHKWTINSLHQLQNLFFTLTGEELTIEL